MQHAALGNRFLHTAKIARRVMNPLYFPWQDNATLSAELATSQGDEIEEYKGSLALRFAF